jgi:hypothetical protein
MIWFLWIPRSRCGHVIRRCRNTLAAAMQQVLFGVIGSFKKFFTDKLCRGESWTGNRI